MDGARAESPRVGELLVADGLEWRHLQPLQGEDHVRQDEVHATRLELVRERVGRITPLGRACGPGRGDAESLFQDLERGPCRARHLLVSAEPPEAERSNSRGL